MNGTTTTTTTTAATPVEWLKDTVFADKFDDDGRTLAKDALVSGAVPSWALEYWGGTNDDSEGVVCGLLPPDTQFHNQIGLTVLLQSLFNAILAIGLYVFVIKPQRRQRRTNRDNPNGRNRQKVSSRNNTGVTPTTAAVLFALGIALPCVLLEPIWAVRTFEIRNVGMIMVFLATPIVNTTKIVEGLYGFAPTGSTTGMLNYVMYFSCFFGMEFDRDKGTPKRTTLRFLAKQLATLGRDFAVLSVVVSVLQPNRYELLSTASSSAVDSMDHTLSEMLDWRHLVNNYFAALLISISLSQSCAGVGLIYNLLYGVQTYDMVLNPMLKSRSVTDFWGRRWNVLVHTGLKNGVYKPVRSATLSRGWAVAATFVASGLIHEYVNYVMFGGHGHRGDAAFVSAFADGYKFRWKQMIFFGWNGTLLLGEYVFGATRIARYMAETLPSPIITALVMSTALPLGHLFTGDWIRGGYFDAIYQSGFVVVCEPQ